MIATADNIHSDADSLAASQVWPSVSVLVPAWQEATTIEGCLTALRTVDYPNWELIVIAGGPDGTYGVVEACSADQLLTLLRQLPDGKNAALSLGLNAARGEVIVVLDADSQVGPNWLRQLVAPLVEGAHASCGDYQPLRQSWVARIEEMDKIAGYLVAGTCILQGSGSIAVWRSALEQAGGFPATVRTGVDWDLDRRLARHGLVRRFAPAAVVRTSRPSTIGEYWRNEVRWRRAHLRLSLFRPVAELVTWLLREGRYYLFAWGLGGGLVISVGLFIAGLIDQACAAAALTMVLWMATALRRHQTLVAVARHTGEPGWLRLGPGVVFLLSLSFAATWWATLTLARQTVHFKGPR